MSHTISSVFSRRAALGGIGIGAAGLTLAACSTDEKSEDSNVNVSGPSSPTDVAASSEVPVGSALKATAGDFTVMVTQPAEGDFHAFSSVCTHQGCALNVQNNLLACPCHASKFSIEDGSVQGGPAPEPLAEFPVEVKDGRVVVSAAS